MGSPDSHWWIRLVQPYHAHAGEVGSLVQKIRQHTDGAIWWVGGADTVRQSLQDRLIDELILACMPLLIGEGIRLFQPDYPTQ
ncbi:MAG: dihydrofolate reductase family protein, partial [Thermostichus sp. DG02_5_bins_236]